MKRQKGFYSFKSILLLGSLVFVFNFYAFNQEGAQSKYFELENGLKVFLYKRSTLPMINLVFAVNLGSKNESEETSGLVHILEHYILFRGTEFRSGSEISQDIRRHGAHFNAHTGRDLALFEMSLPSEYADFALQNQKEILFNLKITQEELDKEKKVILEELSQIQDDPLKYATSLAYQNLFRNHSYQRPIYGKREIIEAATKEQIENFYRDYFIPPNCALAIVGDFNIEEMEEKVKKVFGPLEGKKLTPSKFEKIQRLEKTIEIEREMDVNQAYLVIGTLAPDYNNPDQYAIDILTEILGRGVNPMLNYPLKGKRKLAHSISMSYISLKYSGAILIYLTLDQKFVKSAKNETIQFLKMTRRQNYSKKDFFGEDQFYAFDYLESSKNQLKFAFHIAQEKGLSVATSLARFILLNENQNRGKYSENIKKIKSSDLRKVAGKYLSKGKYVIVSILPKKEK